MSVCVLSKVWEGYPGGGSELLVLLALADWSDDNGKCWPSIPSIGKKVRLSADQARRVTHRLIKDGYLHVTAWKDGGRHSRRYQIQIDKLTSCVNAAPDTDASPPLAAAQGHPLQSNASRTVIDTSKNHQEVAQALPSTSKKSKGRRVGLTLKEFIEHCQSVGELPIPADDSIFDYAAKVGINDEMVALAWQEFKARYLNDASKCQKDWRAHFRNAVRGNWHRLWYLKEGENAQWTTAGEQARRDAI